MNIQKKQKKSQKRMGIAILALIVLVLVSYGVYAKNESLWPFTTKPEPSTVTPSNEANTIDEETKPDTDNDDVDPVQTDTEKTPSENEPTDTETTNEGVPVTITSVQTVDSSVRIRSLIGAVTNSGSCDIQLTKNEKTVTQTSGIQALASSSTCKGFTIPLSQLSSGTWNITLSVVINGKTSTATKEYQVN